MQKSLISDEEEQSQDVVQKKTGGPTGPAFRHGQSGTQNNHVQFMNFSDAGLARAHTGGRPPP
jgi:hypothetical protein